MNLVDSSGWLEYLTDDKNAKFFASVIEKTDELLVSPINIYEIYKKVLKEKNENFALQVVGLMQQAKIVEVSSSIAIQAAKFSYEYKIPMADSIIYTTARMNDATIWTQDYDFKDLDGVKFIKKN
ncbi:MAG: type II toxin-antitoxin system VapC family toxin [Bacteroidetes bacterium]|nr:type II toxin-antitoxin system VapC family toxin [Bacteroidota bacterium]MBU1679480.1 type II toxin-antitoxin system VapC family toxin [Bacteroidota bacterium]MBU2505165.1 type II toxin-antitoxin system VapC family toxin [Bacteroidota bacterium]